LAEAYRQHLVSFLYFSQLLRRSVRARGELVKNGVYARIIDTIGDRDKQKTLFSS
jgi:hypothetical protein